jgi:hypothetical protein
VFFHPRDEPARPAPLGRHGNIAVTGALALMAFITIGSGVGPLGARAT